MPKLRIKKTDPPVKSVEIIKADSPQDNTADIRDILSNFAGKGYTSLSDENARANFISLQKLVGQPMAQKLTTQAFLFNQRPGANALPPADRVRQFYEIGSNDKDVHGVLQKVKAFGSGPLAALNTSPNTTAMALSGREQPIIGSIPMTQPNKVKLWVKKQN